MVKKIFAFFFRVISNNRILSNVTNQSKDKSKVLVSYTTLPFYMRTNRHTNNQEIRAIAEIFHELGYRVDVVNYACEKRINYSDYKIIFGFGQPFEKSFRTSNSRLIRIYYATGAHVFHQNAAEAQRVAEVNARHNSNLLPKRLVSWCWTLSTNFCDHLIILGNSWTESTYREYTKSKISMMNATALLNNLSNSKNRNISKNRMSFLWFGSSGLIHKGLDLCLIFFSEHPELTLHICGPKEDDFFRVFEDYFRLPNIIFHGFVSVNSSLFLDISEKCVFAILPSCSEGQATALLTAMGTGLIPVATRFTGIDVPKYGYIIEALTVEAIAATVSVIDGESDEVLTVKSEKSTRYVNRNHTLGKFKKDMRKILTDITNEE